MNLRARAARAHTVRSVVLAWALQNARDRAVSADDLAEALGVGRGEAVTARDALVRAGYLERTDDGRARLTGRARDEFPLAEAPAE